MRLTAYLLALTLPVFAAGADLAGDALAILKKNCIACHGAGLTASHLDLRTRDAALAGGERGEAMVPNYPEKSRLYLLASHQQNPAMPPGSKLADADLETLRRWILAGAPWPEQAGSTNDADARAALAAMEERPITGEDRAFWAFGKPVRPPVPEGGNPVDAFLRAKWKELGLRPSGQADPRTLVRRAFLDLIGLPPSQEEIRAYVDDNRPDAWSRLIERLLASPHYGERQARSWLDVVRYADSGGYEYDNDRPSAWRYRDWVVRAFNSDMRYDRFLREQLAGDELDRVTTGSIVATGFLRLGPENNLKNEMTRQDELDDLVSTTAQTFLGMTVGCARCHNHKFDPIPQKDYYRMQAVFFSLKNSDHPLVSAAAVDEHKAAQQRIDEAQQPLKKRKTGIEKPYRDLIFEEKVSKLAPYMREAWHTPPDKRNDGQRLNARQIEKTLEIKEPEIAARMTPADKQAHEVLVAGIARLEKQRPASYDAAMTVAEHGREALPSYFLHRGNPSSKGSLMKPGGLTVVMPFAELSAPEGAQTTYRRRSFAEWLTSPENPLTARVMVNRLWQRHFGEGIVATPNNFGRKGDPPTHPQLLDWLATEFVAQGWSMKAMHRLMMTSEAYRMSSDDLRESREKDPDNRFLWRQARLRLDIETIRDGMLAAAGMLDRTLGGPAVLPYIDPALYQSSSRRTWNGSTDDDPATWRRSLYVFSKRSIRYPLFESFDQPDMIISCARRNRSVTAPQALLLMNNAAVRMQAARFAGRVKAKAGDDVGRQIALGFELALARPPQEFELRASKEFIAAAGNGLADFCQALFNLNEFVYMP